MSCDGSFCAKAFRHIHENTITLILEHEGMLSYQKTHTNTEEGTEADISRELSPENTQNSSTNKKEEAQSVRKYTQNIPNNKTSTENQKKDSWYV